MILSATVFSWPGAHHLLVLLSLPTTEPLWVGTEPISSLCTQPLSCHVCAEWHPVLTPPSCLCRQHTLPYWKSETVCGLGLLCARMGGPGLVIASDSPEPPPCRLPLSRASHVIGNKSQECQGPLGCVTASGWAPGISTGMSGSWRVARMCP